MHLSTTTDYAIRCILYLATHTERAASSEIGKAMGIPGHYVQQILKHLVDERIVQSELGHTGGYVLYKGPEEITLYDIIRPFEKTMCINRCLEEDGQCSRNGSLQDCPVRSYYVKLQGELEGSLKNMTVKQLMERSY